MIVSKMGHSHEWRLEGYVHANHCMDEGSYSSQTTELKKEAKLIRTHTCTCSYMYSMESPGKGS